MCAPFPSDKKIVNVFAYFAELLYLYSEMDIFFFVDSAYIQSCW